MKNWDRQKTEDYLYKALFLLIVIFGFIALYYYALPAVGTVLKFIVIASLPFILAWVCAIISEGATNFMNRKLHMPRGLAVIILILLFFGFAGIMVAVLVSTAGVLVSKIAGNMSYYYSVIVEALNRLQEKLTAFDIGEEQFAQVQKWVSDFFADAGKWLTSLASGTVDIISSTSTGIVFVIVFFVSLFFFCRDHHSLVEKMARIVPEKQRSKVTAVYARFADVIRGFCVAQLALIGVSMLICILFFFILGVDNAFSIGVLCGILDILPIVGPTTIILPWAIFSLIEGNLFMGIGLIALLAVLTVVKNVLQPKFVGDRIGLHPLVTLVGIFVGMKVFGLWGLALGPIILAMAVCVYNSIREVNRK